MSRDFQFPLCNNLKSNLKKDFLAKQVPFNLASTMELLGCIMWVIQKQ